MRVHRSNVRTFAPCLRRERVGFILGASLVLATAVGCAAGSTDDGRRFTGGLGSGDEPGADGKSDDPDAGADTEGFDTDGADTDGANGDAEMELDELSEFVFELGHLDIGEWVPKTQTDCMNFDCPVDGQEGEEFCAYVHYNETAHASDFVAFQPNSATLWPGNIVQGGDAQEGLLTPIGLPRAPMTFSVSLDNLQGSPTGQMEDPSLSAFREERNRILAAGVSGATPAHLSYNMQQVYDASQVAVSVGASVGWAGVADFSAMFEFENTQRATKVLVDFTQAYYTIDVDTPGLPSDFFEEGVTIQQLENFTGENNPPMYVQSITYGRRVLFALESSYNANAVKTAFDAGFDAYFVSGGVEVATEHREVLDQTHISALVLGGSGSEAVKTVFGFEGLLEYLSTGGNFSKDSPGAPIAYKLAYLDNTGVELAFTTDYSERQCYDNFVDVSGELAKLDYLGGNDDGSVEVFGWLQFRVAPPGEADPCRGDAPNWQTMWDRNDDGAQTVYGIWVPTNPTKQTQYDVEVFEDNQLCIRGRLREADNCFLFCDDDDFGSAALGPIPMSSGWAGDYDMEFSDEGTVIATVRISLD